MKRRWKVSLLKDLTILKGVNGPFTSLSEVDAFLNSNLFPGKNLSRLYIEVRYARDTSLSIPKTSDIFRLMKDYKKLAIKKYATTLRLFLDNGTTKTQSLKSDLSKSTRSLKDQNG